MESGDFQPASQFTESDIQIIEQFKSSFLDNSSDVYNEHGEEYSQKNETVAQSHRASSMIECMTQNLEILFCMRHILSKENANEILKPYFSEEEISDIKVLYASDTLDANCLDIDHPKLVDNIEFIRKSDFVSEICSYKAELPKFKRTFLSNVIALKKIPESITVNKEMAKEKALNEMWRSNIKTQLQTSILTEELVHRKRAFNKICEDKCRLIEEKQEYLTQIKSECDLSIQEKMVKFKKNMLKMCVASKREQEVLAVDNTVACHTLNLLVSSNLADYRVLRNNKSKLTQQLQYWIAKYDEEVGVKTYEISKLKNTLNELNEEFEKWKVEVCAPQLEQYKLLMTEKENEEKRRQEEAQLWFAMNRAARVLQKYWRMMMAKKKMKKSKSKGKKGKK